MPETAAVGDAYQVRIVGRVEGQETNNVLHFVAANSDTDVLVHLVQVLANCFVTNVLPVLSSAWTLESIKWKRVSPTLGVEFVHVPAGAGPGGGSAVALPSYASACISVRTAQGGRSKRGRMYVPGIPEEATTNSLFNTSEDLWLGLIAFSLCMITNFKPGDPPGANSWAWSIYSRKIGGSAFPYAAAGFTPVLTASPVQVIATTRSRKLGRGA